MFDNFATVRYENQEIESENTRIMNIKALAFVNSLPLYRLFS